jgi:DeoR family transcriptional regulator of aga operon
MKARLQKRRRLMAEERHRAILTLLDKHGRVTIDDLIREFDVSAVTGRTDLDWLARMGALVRCHGGAVKLEGLPADYPVAFKKTLHQVEKKSIGLAAAKFVKPNQVIILDSGTTTLEVARQIKIQHIRPLTVITNALNVAIELSNAPEVSLVVLGGILRQASLAMVGPQSGETLMHLNADQLFLGVDGLDLEIGLTTPGILEAQLAALMMRVSKTVTVVADSSKFGRRSLSVIAKLDSIHRLITDSAADPKITDEIRSRGIEVVIVGDSQARDVTPSELHEQTAPSGRSDRSRAGTTPR